MITEDNESAQARLDDEALFDLHSDPKGETPQEAPAEQPAPVAAQPEEQPAPVAEAEQPQPQEQEAPQPAAQAKETTQDAPRVPLRELLEERERRQALQRQIEELQRRIPQPEPQKAPDFWEQPETSVDYRVREAVNPIQRVIERQQDEFSRYVAETKYGADAVKEAYADLARRFAEGDPTAHLDNARAMSSGLKMYETLVDLHRERQIIREIGTDPAAYQAKMQEKLLNDPAFLAKAIERAQASARQQPSAVTAPKPATMIPSVSRMGAAAAPVASSLPDLSDEDQFDKWASQPARRTG